jgi:predicted metalloprotease with PDZ domain
LPFRAGFISAQDYLTDLNQTALRYYTDSMIATPNDEIARSFWKDTRVRVLAYDRGALYFAKVNAQIVRESKGRRSLDDLILSLIAERRSGHPMTTGSWAAFLRKELGEPGVAEWREMLAGRRIDLASDTFGSCFIKTGLPVGEFDMGFDFVASLANRRLVQGLKPGSNAALAGLRDGDVIKKMEAGDQVQSTLQAMVTLQVERSGQSMTIRYSARGRVSPIPQWVLKTGEAGRCDSHKARMSMHPSQNSGGGIRNVE